MTVLARLFPIAIATTMAAASLGAQQATPISRTLLIGDTRVRVEAASQPVLERQMPLLNDAFAYALTSATCTSVETMDDLRARVGAAGVAMMAGADSLADAQLAAAGRRAGASLLAYASVGQLGTQFVVTGTVLDVTRAAATGRASITVSSLAQVPAALRTVGQRLAQAGSVGAPNATTLTARYRSSIQVKGEDPRITNEGTYEISPEAIRASIGGGLAPFLQLAMAGLAQAADSGRAVPRDSTGGLWVLARIATGETWLVDDASRSVLPILTTETNTWLSSQFSAAGILAGKDFDAAIQEMGKKTGMGDPGRRETTWEKFDIRASRIQDSVWISMEGSECPEFLVQAPNQRSGRMACRSGMVALQATTGSRLQADRVNGYQVEHWQLVSDTRAALKRVGVSGVFSILPKTTRVDARSAYDVWVPRGAGFCLPTIGFSAFNPWQQMFDQMDRQMDGELRLGEQWRKYLAALRKIPAGATRTVLRNWGDDVKAKEPVTIIQSDVFDIVPDAKIPPERFVIPPGYRKVEPPPPAPAPPPSPST